MFKLLKLSDPEWQDYISLLPEKRRDIHFDTPLLAAYTEAYGWFAGLTVTENSTDFICQPVLITNNLQLRHAYNFGGPVGTEGINYSLKYEHWSKLIEWKQSIGVKQEYCTLNPFLINHQLEFYAPFGGSNKPEYRKDSVWVDLTKPLEIRGTTRRIATKAEREGTIICQVSLDALKEFEQMYAVTMDKRKAAPHWLFPHKFFATMCEGLGRRAVLLFAFVNGVLESGCLMVIDHKTAYYHFAGTLGQRPNLGVNHLLILKAIDFTKDHGCERLYLGGGVTDNPLDSLLLFKTGFSKQTAPVYSYQLIS